MKSAKAMLELTSFFIQMVKNVLAAMEGFGTTHDARSLEAYVEAQSKAVGLVVYETCWRIHQGERAVPLSPPCPCGQRQHHKGARNRELRTVLGPLNQDWRHYYHCDHCQRRTYWGDELRGASDFSQLAEERIAFMGKDEAYEQGAETLQHLGIMELAGSTIRKVCRRVGARLRARLDHEAAQQHCTDEIQAEEKPSGLAISVDGVMVGRIDPQHRRRGTQAHKIRGKTALKHFFHEVKTLVVFEFDKAGKALRKTYQATQERVEDFREKVALEAKKRGAETAPRLAFLGDGAAWVWKTASELFPKAIQILDWYHAMEHIWAVGRARFGSREKELWAWVTARESELWQGQAEAVIEAIRNVSVALGTPDESLSETARATDPRWIAFRNVGYFEENRHRISYPEYRKQGLPIGSGVVESACKHVVASRMKHAGMRWDEPGEEDILALRCHYLNGRWDSLWEKRELAA